MSNGAADNPRRARADDRPSPLADKAAALKQAALEKKLNGKIKGDVVEVAEGEFVDLELEGEDPVLTMLGEFADLPHNSLPEPNRTFDNSTIWEPDFSREYFLDLLFDDSPGANSMRSYFLEQSSGRYTVEGDVTDWVRCPKATSTTTTASEARTPRPTSGCSSRTWPTRGTPTRSPQARRRRDRRLPRAVRRHGPLRL